MMFQLKYKYSTDLANVLNYNIKNDYYFLSVGIQNENNQTWFDNNHKFPDDIVKQIELGVLIKKEKI